MKLFHTCFPKDWASWRVMIFLGLTMMGAGYGFQYWGEQYVSSGLAAVLFATAPLFVVIFAQESRVNNPPICNTLSPMLPAAKRGIIVNSMLVKIKLYMKVAVLTERNDLSSNSIFRSR